MARGAMRCAVAASAIRLMIGANWIVRANSLSIQGTFQDLRESCGCANKATERPLSSRARSVNQDSTAIDIATIFGA